MKKKNNYRSTLIDVPFEEIVKADWNYKEPGTPEEIESLCKSISEDGSAGVLAVRIITIDGVKRFEAIDGNHRVDALEKLGWNPVRCENFGEITQAQAALIAFRRNKQWFQDDPVLKSRLLKDTILSEYTVDRIAELMGESAQDIEALSKLCDFDFNQYQEYSGTSGDEPEEDDAEYIKLEFSVPKEVNDMFMKWMRICIENNDDPNNFFDKNKAFEFAVVEALNTQQG